MDNTYATTKNKEQEKIKVESIDIVVTGTKEKPYYAIKYRKIGNNEYYIGYGSYTLGYVLEWKEQCFELIEQENNDFGKWIPCSERLPKDRQIVVADIECGIEDRMCIFAYFKIVDHMEHWINANTGFRVLANVVQWTPLPEPYREEE